MSSFLEKIFWNQMMQFLKLNLSKFHSKDIYREKKDKNLKKRGRRKRKG